MDDQAQQRVLTQPKRAARFPLWFTITAWFSWLLSIALLWSQHRLGVLHPYAHVFLLLLVLTIGSAVCGLVHGIRRMYTKPRRRVTLGGMLAAVAPLVLWLLMGLYVLRELQQGNAPENAVGRTVAMGVASLMELEALYLYPHRMETDRLVMFYDDRITEPERDIQAMDAHVAGLEELTGRPLREKIYWVRGRLLGRGQSALYGIALGTPESPDWESQDSKGHIDRHELAHAVLHQHYRPDTNPPSLLVEGWAESQGGHTSRALASWALQSRKDKLTAMWPDRSLYLRELIGPGRYHRMDGPTYNVGGGLVSFLLREYGIERFLQLYFTCKPGTFEAQCKAIFKTDIDTLERQFWDDAERLVAKKEHESAR